MIGYVGLSHLGLISSLAAAEKGFATVAFDRDPTRVNAIAAGRLSISEPGLDELFASVRERIRFSCDPTELAGCRVVYVSIDVPTDPDGRSDLAPVHDLLEVVVGATQPGTVVVILSQVHPGFTRQLAPLVEQGGRRLFYQVETLVFGRAVERALRPERFILGCRDPGAPLPDGLQRFLEVFGCPILPMRLESAELTKIAINLFLVASLSTTNMLAEVCEAIGADWLEIAPALRLDRRIGPHAYLAPGLGIGGGNLLRDVATVQRLAWEGGGDGSLVDAWLANSRYRREWAFRTLHTVILGRVSEPVIGMWGLAYKQDTAVTKNSPALRLIEALQPIAVKAYDPKVRLEAGRFPHVAQCASAIDACRGVDALAIMTPWPEFAEVALDPISKIMKGRVLVDPYRMIGSADSERLGFTHVRLGVGAAPEVVVSCP